MKFLFSLLFSILISLNFAQIDDALYSKVKINIENKDINNLAQLGIEVDHGFIKKGKFIINDYSEYELNQIESAGFSYEVLIQDVKAWYRDQNREHNHEHLVKAAPPEDCFNGTNSNNEPIFETPINYSYGSMGGYVTYSEMLEVLDSMVAKFPNLISPRTAIGSPVIDTWMGNNVYWLRISDNPNTNETTEPEVLFTSLHHAREPNSLSQNLFYMWYLLENYATNSEVKYLVDNTEIYFVPCVNPDGYILNEQNDPNGGGLIRKNGRDNNNDGVYNSPQDGVDLNRNYAFEWAYDNTGSSPNTNSQTYRGPSAASEPETQAIQQFCNDHEFEISMNYHTYGNLLIHPWGYTDDTTSEHATFQVFGDEMTQYNNYTFGTGTQTVGYTVNGDSDDWMYGETVSKGKIYSMTPEAGNESVGFWPMQSQIDEFNKANMHQNLSVSRLVLNYVEGEEISPDNTITNLSGSFDFEFIKKGLKNGNVTIDFTSVSPNLNISFTPQVLTLLHLETQNINIPFTINTNAVNNEELRFVVSIDNGLFTYYDTISKTYLTTNFSSIFNDHTNTLTNWNGNGWSLTTNDFYSSPNSISESPNGNYTSNQNKTITLANPVDLTNATNAKLSFWAKWDIENDYDYTQVLISIDNGANFIPLCGLYSNEGTGDQDPGMPLYDNVQNAWVKENIDITEYVGNEILIQFYFYSDAFVNEDGFYFDDFSIDIIELPHMHNVSTTEYTCNENNEMMVSDTFQNQWNLDSIYTVNTIYVEADSTYNLSFTLDSSQIGFNIDTLQNLFGCDSIVYNEVKWNPGMSILNLNDIQLSIYPNPIKDVLNFELSAVNVDLEVEIMNTYGQKIETFTIQSSEQKIVKNLSNFTTGVYLVNIRSGNKIKTIKFLKM